MVKFKAKPKIKPVKYKAKRYKGSKAKKVKGTKTTIKTKSGKSLVKRTASATWKGTKKLAKWTGKAIKGAFLGLATALPWIANKLLGNDEEIENQVQDPQIVDNSAMPELSNIQSNPNDKNNESDTSQLEAGKESADLTADAKTKQAQESNVASSSYNKAKSLASSALINLESAGIAAHEFSNTIPEVVEPKDSIKPLPTEVSKEVSKTGALGVVGLQTLFGKIDGVKDSVIQIGKMLYAAQDIQINQNNEQLKHLAEIQKILKEQGKISAADTEANITEKQVNVEKDKIDAETARKMKAVADKAYQEATNANAESTEINRSLGLSGPQRLQKLKERLTKSVKPSRSKAFGAALLGAGLLGAAKKFFGDDNDEEIEDDEDDDRTYEDPNTGETYQVNDKGELVDQDGNIIDREGSDNLLEEDEFEDEIPLEDGSKLIHKGKGLYEDESGNQYQYNPETEEVEFKQYNPNTLVGTGMNFMNDYGDEIYTGGVALEGAGALWNHRNIMANGGYGTAWRNWATDTKTGLTDARDLFKVATGDSKNAAKIAARRAGQFATLESIDGAAKAELKAINKELTELASQKAAGTLTKAAEKKAAAKIGTKLAGKVLGKIPGVSLAMSAYFAKERWDDGDYVGAVIEGLSGVASCVPVIGTAASFILDGINLCRDLFGGDHNIDSLEAQRSYVAANSPGWEGWINDNPGMIPPPEAFAGVADTTHPRNVTPGLYREQQMQRTPEFQRMQERNRNKAHWDEELRLEQAAPRIPGQPVVRLYTDIPDWYRAEYEAEQQRRINDIPQFRAAPHYAEGGVVPGDPSDGDSVPAILQPGEFVMPVDLVQRLATALEAGGINFRSGIDSNNGPVRGFRYPKTPVSREVNSISPRVAKTDRLTPSQKPAVVKDTSLNPKDFEDSIHNTNFDIAAAVNTVSELPNYDLADGEDSNVVKDPTEASIRGICARYIRTALEAGGINVQTRPGEAYEYAKWLPKNGFREVDNNSMLLPGDISVEGKTDDNPHGHIAMWNGVQWVSDRLQNARLVTPPGKHGKLTLLRHHSMPETKVSENTDYGKDDWDYGVDNSTAASTMELKGLINGMPSNVQELISSSPQSQQDYVRKVRPLLLNALKSKNFVDPNLAETYADILTAQSSVESAWGVSGLSTNYNNYSGMTNGTSPLHSIGSVAMNNKAGTDPNNYATFNSIEDWADEYVEYLNRKWNAFNGDPSEYFNRLQNNGTGQSYATDPNYVPTNLSRLARVKALASTVFPDYQGGRQFLGNPTELALSAVDASQSGRFYSDSRNGYVDLGYNQYKSLCTSGPATWYREAGGPELNGYWWNTGNPSTATDTNITKKGFAEIWHGTADDARANIMQPLVQPGDIMISYGVHRDGLPSSHAQMWDGHQWLSDTRQRSTFVYPIGRMGDRSAVLYRYAPEINNVTPAKGNGFSSFWKNLMSPNVSQFTPGANFARPQAMFENSSNPLSGFNMFNDDRGDANESEVTRTNESKSDKPAQVIYAPKTMNQGGNTTVNNHTEVHNHIHTDSAAQAELS